jgi:hypothetical protein
MVFIRNAGSVSSTNGGGVALVMGRFKSTHEGALTLCLPAFTATDLTTSEDHLNYFESFLCIITYGEVPVIGQSS